MKLRLIAEGSTKKERKAMRWGISFLVGDVLFDTFGREDIFRKNAKRFGIDLNQIRHVVISHDDWDHIAGLEEFLKKRPGTKVLVCSKAGKDLKDLVKNNGGKLVEVSGMKKISPNIYSLGQMCADTGRGILYEQALVVKSRKGFSVITGCAHPGIVKIVKQAIMEFGKNIYAICGGFHLKDNTPEENKRIVAELRALGIKKVVPLHCSGRVAGRIFDKVYGDDRIRLRQGNFFEI